MLLTATCLIGLEFRASAHVYFTPSLALCLRNERTSLRTLAIKPVSFLHMYTTFKSIVCDGYEKPPWRLVVERQSRVRLLVAPKDLHPHTEFLVHVLFRRTNVWDEM